MSTMMIYLIKSALFMMALYAVYWLFLRKDTFFSMNRFYLLASVLLSVLIPLLPIRWTLNGLPSPVMLLLEPVMITPEKSGNAPGPVLQWMETAAVVYLTGSLIFLCRFCLQLSQLYMIIRRFGISERLGRRVVLVDRGYSPFSFFNLVFINEATVPNGNMTTILEHEHVHIRQFHSMDMILLELVAIFQWFNPVVWLAGREMKSIHEFLADEGVLQNGISHSIYQQMILNETMGIQVNDLPDHFNVSLLKKRIAMMTKSKSSLWAGSKLLIALPAILGLLFIFNARSYSRTDMTKQEAGPTIAPVTQDKKVYNEADKMPAYAGGQDAMIKFLVGNIKYPEDAKKNKVTGKVFVTFIVRADGSVTDVKIIKGIGSGCDEEALRVVKLMPKWEPGEIKGKPVDVQVKLPIQFALDDKKKEEPKK